MAVTQTQVDNIKEDIRAISDTVSDILTRVTAHDARFDQLDRRLEGVDRRLESVDRRLEGADRRLEGVDGTLREILTLVRARS